MYFYCLSCTLVCPKTGLHSTGKRQRQQSQLVCCAERTPGSLDSWHAVLCLRSSRHIWSVYSNTQCNGQEIKIRIPFLKMHTTVILNEPTRLIKMAPDILNSTTLFSAICSCCICFTNSLSTETIQAYTAPTFPLPFRPNTYCRLSHLFPASRFLPLNIFVSPYRSRKAELENISCYPTTSW